MTGPDDFPVLPPAKRSAKLQKYSAPALEKGLEILEFLSLQTHARSMLEIAIGVGRNKNEIFRMIIVLEENGYIERQDADSFLLSDKLYHLGLRKPSNRRLTDVALPAMDAFCEAMPFCCFLAVSVGIEALTMAKAESPDAFTFSVTVGQRVAIHESAEGLCMLAYMPQPRRLQIFRRLGLNGKVETKLQTELTQIAQQGFAKLENAFVTGVTNVAVPIFDAFGEVAVGALCVPFVELKHRQIPIALMQKRLKSTAEEINFEIARRSTTTFANHSQARR